MSTIYLVISYTLTNETFLRGFKNFNDALNYKKELEGEKEWAKKCKHCNENNKKDCPLYIEPFDASEICENFVDIDSSCEYKIVPVEMIEE